PLGGRPHPPARRGAVVVGVAAARRGSGSGTGRLPGDGHRGRGARGTPTPKGAEPGPDGLARCPRGPGRPRYRAHPAGARGRPVRDDAGMFERLCLEAFQSGLSWLTILRKREGFRAAFAGFDMESVARFGPDDVTRLLGDAGIVRNRAKIEAAIGNARAALQ